MTATVDREMLAGPTRGSVDLVAVERVRAGNPTDLTADERDYLIATYDGTKKQGRQIAAALGITLGAVQKRHLYMRKQAARRPT